MWSHPDDSLGRSQHIAVAFSKSLKLTSSDWYDEFHPVRHLHQSLLFKAVFKNQESIVTTC